MTLYAVPSVGDVFALSRGDAIVLETRSWFGIVEVLCVYAGSIHPFVIWRWTEGAFFAGRYFKSLDEAETEWHST